MIFAYTVRYKAKNHWFYRRIHGVKFLDSVTIRGVPCYECLKANKSGAFIPVAETTLRWGRKVDVIFLSDPAGPVNAE